MIRVRCHSTSFIMGGINPQAIANQQKMNELPNLEVAYWKNNYEKAMQLIRIMIEQDLKAEMSKFQISIN